MNQPPHEFDLIVNDGELAFTDAGLEPPERYVGFEGTLVVVAPDVRSHVTLLDEVTEDTSLLQCYPEAAEWFQDPYCDDGTVLIYPEGTAVGYRYHVVDARRDTDARRPPDERTRGGRRRTSSAL